MHLSIHNPNGGESSIDTSHSRSKHKKEQEVIGNTSPSKEQKTPFKSKACDRIYSGKLSLKQHIASVHEGKKPFKCKACHYSCSIKGSLSLHVASVHERKKQFKCEACDCSFLAKGPLKRHVTSVHEGKIAIHI